MSHLRSKIYIILLIFSFLFAGNTASAYTTEGVSNTVGTTNNQNVAMILNESSSNGTLDTIYVSTPEQKSPYGLIAVIGIVVIIGYIIYRKKKNIGK
jgi:hypothetical protein